MQCREGVTRQAFPTFYLPLDLPQEISKSLLRRRRGFTLQAMLQCCGWGWGNISGTCYFDIHVVIKQEVFSFEVTVHYLSAVTVFNSGEDLPEFAPRLGLTQAAMVSKVICGNNNGFQKVKNQVEILSSYFFKHVSHVGSMLFNTAYLYSPLSQIIYFIDSCP